MIAAKQVHLDEIVGHLKEEKEEEPEDEVLGESNTGSLLLPPLCFHFNLTSSSLYLFILPLLFLFFYNFSPSDDSKEENREVRRPMTKEEEDIDILQSWLEVGGQPALPEGEAQGMLAEVSKFPCPLPLHFIFLFLSFLFAAHSFPHNLDVLDCYWLFSSFFVGCETTPMCKPKEGRGKKARSRGSAA